MGIPLPGHCVEVPDTGDSPWNSICFGIPRTKFVSFLCVGCFTGLVSAHDTATPITVFVAKKIITMDPGWPTATAVAVRDGKILSVGSLEDLEPWLRAAPHRIDRRLADKVMMPGFVEPHGHPLLGGCELRSDQKIQDHARGHQNERHHGRCRRRSERPVPRHQRGQTNPGGAGRGALAAGWSPWKTFTT